MEFKLEKNLFFKSIQKVQSVVERKNSVPLLSNVRLVAELGKLELNATDLEVAIRDIIDVDVVEPGTITVSAKKLYEVLKELPDDMVHFKLEENNWIMISCGPAWFKLVGMSDEDFPSFPEFDESSLIPVPSEILDSLTRRTIYAVSHDENRPVLNGVLLLATGSDLKMVATDGHRLAYVQTKNEMGLSDIEVVIPQKGIHEIQRMINSGAERMNFGITENHIIFKIENEVVLTRLVEGKFPNYSMVIPESTEFSVKINTDNFYNSLKRVSLFSDLKVRGVKVDVREGELEITASTPEFGEARDKIMAEYTGEPLSIGFNVNYLLDLLKTIDSEDLFMKVNEASGPILFEPMDQNGLTYLSIVMPMIV